MHKCVEAKASHMIDNKWVAVRPHGGTAFQAAQHAERQRMVHEREKAPRVPHGFFDSQTILRVYIILYNRCSGSFICRNA